jgi:hypothetical protein
MRTWKTSTLVILAIAALLFSAVACDDDSDDGDGDAPTVEATEDDTDGETPGATEPSGAAATVETRLSEYAIVPDPASVPAGSVTFNANNVGGATHEVHVFRTDLAPDALPTNDDGSVDEEGEGIEEAGHIEEFEAMSSESGTFELEAGAYVLICNVIDEAADGTTTSHYAEGMTVAFTVQ